jgi:hypothetical protein
MGIERAAKIRSRQIRSSRTIFLSRVIAQVTLTWFESWEAPNTRLTSAVDGSTLKFVRLR